MLKLKPFTRGSWSVGGAPRFPPFTFIAHPGFDTRILAHMLDSLVRVSRRVNKGHFVNIQTPRRKLTRRRIENKHSVLSKPSIRPDHFTSQTGVIPRSATRHSSANSALPFPASRTHADLLRANNTSSQWSEAEKAQVPLASIGSLTAISSTF